MFLRNPLFKKSITIILVLIFLIGGQMANILVKLDLMGETVEGEILSKSSNISTNNVSKPLTEPTERNSGFNGICVDKWQIGDDGSLNAFRGYNGIIFEPTDENGELSTDLAFTVVGSNITNVTFYFDETAQQWATEAYIDGKKMVSDDHIWTFAWDTPVSAKTITFTKWHRPNYNACITHLAMPLDELTFNNKWIENFDSLSQSVADNTVPNYGVLANTGDLTLNDVNGELKDYVEDGILNNSNYPLMIFANGKQIQYHISTDTEYDFDAKQIKIELSNDLTNIENYSFDGINKVGVFYNVNNENPYYITAYDVLAQIMGYGTYNNYYIFSNEISTYYPEFDDMLNETIIVGTNNKLIITVKSYLKTIKIPYIYLEKSNRREAIDKICQIAQLNLIQKDNGDLKFVGARPIITTTQKDNAIIIPLSTQTSSFYPNIISKNKYDKVFLENNKPNVVSENIDTISYIGFKKDYTGSTVSYINALSDNEFEYSTYQRVLYPGFPNGISHYIKFTKEINLPQNIIDSFYYDRNSFIKLLTKNSYIEKNYHRKSDTGVGIVDYEDKRKLRFMQIIDVVGTEETDSYNFIELVNNVDGFNNILSNSGIYPENLICIDKELSTKNKIVFHFAMKYEYNNNETYYTNEQVLLSNVVLSTEVYNTEQVEIYKGDGNTTFSMQSNELLQENTIAKLSEINSSYSNEKIYDLLTDSIIQDYQDGIINAELTVICGDYYDIDGNKVITWQNGEVLQVGDIVRVDKDNEGTTASRYKDGSPRYFRITGRNFRYDGVPLIDLELMEVKVIE